MRIERGKIMSNKKDEMMDGIFVVTQEKNKLYQELLRFINTLDPGEKNMNHKSELLKFYQIPKNLKFSSGEFVLASLISNILYFNKIELINRYIHRCGDRKEETLKKLIKIIGEVNRKMLQGLALEAQWDPDAFRQMIEDAKKKAKEIEKFLDASEDQQA